MGVIQTYIYIFYLFIYLSLTQSVNSIHILCYHISLVIQLRKPNENVSQNKRSV